MQNSGIPGASLSNLAMSRNQAALFETLQARSLSPNVQIMQNYQETYANEPAQQFYHSMPHNASMQMMQQNEQIAAQGAHPMSMSRTFSPPVTQQMQQMPASSTPPNCLPRSHPVAHFNEQYSLIQQARMHHQLRTHNDALMRKQQTFAMRQMMNPPMSRQASAVNIHQVNTSTQTTPNAHNPHAFQSAISSQYGVNEFDPNAKAFNKVDKPNHLQLQQEHQQIVQSLKKDFELQQQQQQQQMVHNRMALAKANSNPFAQRPPAESSAENFDSGRCDSGAESPVHQTLTYKEPNSSSSATSTPTKLLKSPQTKRQLSSLVTFSGWLYKQGSEGLRSWRKRWFVLTDYCLFYYKGPEEDKLLGSILLPSYILNECQPTEVNRKFTFKLEHKNMRTYYLAAENSDYMQRWVQVIRAATLMQNPNELQTRRMLATSIPICTNSVSSNYTTNTYKNAYDPYSAEASQRKADVHPSLNPFLIFDEENEQARQPLYVNAPPKPRRTHNEMDFPMMGADSSVFSLSPENDDLHNEPHSKAAPMNYYTKSMNEPVEDESNYELDAIAQAYANNDFPSSSGKKTYTPKAMPPRPRSADFLEYESKRQYRRYKNHDQPNTFNEPSLPSRPKSSLDINSSMDNYYYSEASYAAKMRQSALYLQNRKIISTGRDDTRLKTLRYENERKRLTNEFNSYMLNNGSLTLPRKLGRESSNESWQYASMLRKAEANLMKGSDANLADHYRSTDMISAATSSISNRDSERFGQTKGGNAAWMADISAGTLLSKTHEELVLLLIQLRRQSDIKERGIARRMNDMQGIQQRLKNESDSTATRLELMARLEVLREEVNKLEQQYEKTKPLINLVDNMVKLGSLYRAGSVQWSSNSFNANATMQRIRSNQKDNENRLQSDERSQWNKFDPDQIEFHNKVQQLYDLDQRLQEESNNMQLLQQDKDEIENALDELNHRFATNDMLPENYVTSKKIQHSLEMELSKVHSQLAENARRLEETVSGNTKLERELLILRQKLQASRDKNTNQFNYVGEARTANAFESELRKIRDTVGDIQRQREELSLAVNQLTLDSHPPPVRVRTTSQEQSGKRTDSNWVETDLDMTHKKNSRNAHAANVFDEPEPLYYQYQQSTDDDHWPNNDKQEIKTVRIVKRESERRHRDKDKMSSSYDPFNTDFVNTSDFASNYHHSSNEARANNYYDDDPSTAKAKMTIKNLSNARSAIKASTHKTDNIFQSNTAREIFNELASGKEDASKSMPKEQQTSKSGTLASIASASSASILYKRFTPRKKKRHNTAPNSENFMDFMAERDAYKYNNRARDDLDMEVVLRSQNQPVENTISGPPDVIRSALGQSSEYLFDK